MADINLTSGNDTYVEPYAERNEWRSFYGLAGSDVLRVYQGGVHPGPGNDIIERLVDPENPNRQVHVALFDYGDNLRINLVDGFAESPTGGRDTLINIRMVHGTGSPTNSMLGDANDNYYWPNWGNDTFEGGAGYDGISLNSGHVEWSPGKFRNLFLSEINLDVSADGRRATITPKVGPSWSISTLDVEYFDVRVTNVDSDPWAQYRFSDFITHQTMARDAIAAGGTLRWNAPSAVGTAAAVTYSFAQIAPSSGPGATGFRAFGEAERTLVREILAHTAAISNLSFNEVTETGATVGQLRFGVSQQSNTKGVAYLPNQAGVGDQAGDVWMDVESMAQLTPGSEGYQALLHEIGHALGLRHPRNVDAGDAWPMQLREQDSRTALSVMAETPSPDGLFRAEWGPLDVLALRLLYGTRAASTGNNTYVLGSEFGNRQSTLTDDGGIDTINASALVSGVQLTLVPATLSNVGISSAGIYGVDNLAITSGTVIENAIGTAADDELIGNDADNSLTGGLGNDWIDGGAGTDTAVFAQPRDAYEVDHAFGFTYVRARDGVSGYDTLVNVERLQFADHTVTLSSGVPLSNDVSLAVDEDASAAGTLPLPDGVTDRATVAWALVSTATHGSATVAANGSYTYTPSANYWGPDSFAFRLTTSTGQNTYRVYVDVKPVNDGAPVGRSQALMLAVNTPHSGRVPTATDVDNDPLSYTVTADPTQGALTFAADGNYTYTPSAGYFGDDAFSYSVSDGMGGSNTYTQTLRVGLRTEEDTALSTTLPDPVDGLRVNATYRIATPASLGLATITQQGQLNFTPTAQASGVDSFAYEVVIGSAVTRIVVGVKIGSVNDGPPVAASASHTLNEDSTLTVQLPTATDPDGAAIVYALDGAPTLGTASISTQGQLVYTPAPHASGNDSLAYLVRDPEGSFNRYTVSLTITPLNDTPTAAPASASLRPGQTLVGLLPAASDADGDRLTYAVASAPAQGQVSINGIGFFTYTPNVGASGSDSFSYTVRDGFGGAASYPVTLALLPVASAADGGGPSAPVLTLAHAEPGGLGLDRAFWAAPRAEHSVRRVGDSLTVSDLNAVNGDSGTRQLVDVERLVFADQLLAFGARAEEVARVAFTLWSPAIASSSALFARGLSWYDRGQSFDALCAVALQYWPEQGQDFAELLVRSSGSTRSAADVLALMLAAGGADAGRAAAVAAVAWDDSVTAALHTTGLINHGIVADLVVAGFGAVFDGLGGGT